MFKESLAKIIKIIVVDDTKSICSTLTPTLPPYCEILNFSSANEALTTLAKQTPKAREKIKIIVCDQNQNQKGMTGAEFLECSKTLVPRTKRVLLIDYSKLDMNAVQGANLYRFIVKPYEIEDLTATISLALEEIGVGQSLLCDREIVGQDPYFLEILNIVCRVCDSTASVLIQSETGTGKELIARALHCNGPRKSKPFIVVNCCSTPETLFEAEMFGHKKGAFTGAYQDRKGLVAQAEGGTLFIDEVGEIPLQVQAKLLRFLQFGEFQPVGSDHIVTANVRIIAATNQDLGEKIEEGTFRKDFYYRLNILKLELPPLRKRPSDIRLLAKAFIKKYWNRPGTPILSSHALKILESYDYPGNVRELENVIQRACLLSRTEKIDLDAFPPELIKKVRENTGVPTNSIAFPCLDNESLKKARIDACKRARNRIERAFLNQLLARFNTISLAAAHAGMQRTYLHSLLTKHGLMSFRLTK